MSAESRVSAETEEQADPLTEISAGSGAGKSTVFGSDFGKRPDRIRKYLTGFLESFEFLFLAESYILRHTKDISFIRNVPVPFRVRSTVVRENTAEQIPANDRVKPTGGKETPSDAEAQPFAGTETLVGTGVSPYELAENMAWIIGISPDFPHTAAYIMFIETILPGKAVDALTAIAAYAADNNKDYDKACVFFRAALCMEPEFLNAMYGYARVCRDMYSQGEDNDYVGNFKAEALVFFELTSLAHPKFSDSFYYLGYAYLNMGLYQKAFLAWKGYLKLSEDEERQKEIRARIQQITVPMEIERGCNAVLSGRYEEGISILEPHTKGRYKEWWPLYYYLGDAYKNTARHGEAIDMYKRVLNLKPSHVESMDELASIYELYGDDELVSKYRNKAELIRNGGFKD
jgi:tetratricopeptide (TPR) repeat protein